MSKLALWAFGVSCVACTSKTNEAVGETQEALGGEYRQTLSASRFDLGRVIGTSATDGVVRTIGTKGTFSVVSSTGYVAASWNADYPDCALAPRDNESQTVSYFRDAGLPSEQEGTIATHSGDASNTTVIGRQVAGVPVLDSFAYASMECSGASSNEGVYWPYIPDSVVADAVSLSRLSETSQYLVKLPVGVGPGRVVIRHAAGPSQSFWVYAAYEVADAAGPRDFGQDGAEIVSP